MRRKKKKNWNKYYLILLPTVLVIFLVHQLWFGITSFPAESQVNQHYKVLLVANSDIAGEMQEAYHNCKAINNLGSSCYLFEFGYHPDQPRFFDKFFAFVQTIVNDNIKPDFVFYTFPYMLFERGKYPTYASLDVAQYESVSLENYGDLPEDKLWWVGLFDSYVVYGNNKDWADNLISNLSNYTEMKDKSILYSFYPTIPKTELYHSDRKELFYVGVNWDVKRRSSHFTKIFSNLDQKPYFAVYGRKEGWSYIKNSYKGTIPFDADTLIKTMQKSGIALLFHSQLHNKYGVPSKRIFEAAAASNVIISDENPFVKKEFGDCVYYVDTDVKPPKVSSAIDKIVKEIQANPSMADQKAACVHNIFLKKFALEEQWKKVFTMHRKFKVANEKKIAKKI